MLYIVIGGSVERFSNIGESVALTTVCAQLVVQSTELYIAPDCQIVRTHVYNRMYASKQFGQQPAQLQNHTTNIKKDNRHERKIKKLTFDTCINNFKLYIQTLA